MKGDGTISCLFHWFEGPAPGPDRLGLVLYPAEIERCILSILYSKCIMSRIVIEILFQNFCVVQMS